MKLKSLPLLFAIGLSTNLFASEYYGFQIINLLNLKDNVKCSGVLLNTENGCKAITNAHCIKGLALKEKNLMILSSNSPTINNEMGKDIYSKIIHNHSQDERSYLIKAKSSSDLAELYFDPSWAKDFCKSSYKLTKENTPRHQHVNEVYTADQLSGQANANTNQHLTGSYGWSSRGPNHTIYYKPSQNFKLVAAGFQNDLATLQSVNPVDFNSLSSIDEKMKSRLNVEFSSLPGFEFIYEVAGINLSQGMSGGALFEIIHKEDQSEVLFKGISSSFYPFMWKSNFIPFSYALDFLESFEDDGSDNFNISIASFFQLASDKESKIEKRKLQLLKKEGKVPPLIDPQIRQLEVLEEKAPARVERSRARFGENDQDDVGGDTNLNCSVIKSKKDPILNSIPPITNCFDLSQVRLKPSGFIPTDQPEKVLIAYDNEQIDGLSSLRKIKRSQSFDPSKLIYRELGGHPEIEIRKNILKNLKGIYSKRENPEESFNDSRYTHAHLNELFTRQFVISPSSNSLIRESLIHDTPLYGELFKNLYNYDIKNSFESMSKIDLHLNVSTEEINVKMKLIDSNYYFIKMIPVFSDDFKRIELQSELTIKESKNFTTIRKENFTLKCDNRNFLRLVCSNDRIEFGLSLKDRFSGWGGQFRFAFWDNFKTKKEALLSKKLQMNYIFGGLERNNNSITRVVNDLSLSDFEGKKLKNILKNKNDLFSFLNFNSYHILNFITSIPPKVKSKIKTPLIELETKTFKYQDRLYHLVFEKKKKYGVLYKETFEVMGVILKGKVSTSAYDIF